jgi:uncharacterized membrane protein
VDWALGKKLLPLAHWAFIRRNTKLGSSRSLLLSVPSRADVLCSKDSLAASATAGLLFGFFAYATYDLTNMATLKDWPLSMTLVDIAWGSAMGALAAAVGYSVLQYFS